MTLYEEYEKWRCDTDAHDVSYVEWLESELYRLRYAARLNGEVLADENRKIKNINASLKYQLKVARIPCLWDALHGRSVLKGNKLRRIRNGR